MAKRQRQLKRELDIARSSSFKVAGLSDEFITHQGHPARALKAGSQLEAEMALAESGRRASALSQSGKAPSRSGAPRLKSEPRKMAEAKVGARYR